MRIRTILAAAAAPAALAAVMLGTTAASADTNGRNGTTLSETISNVTASNATVYHWKLDKTGTQPDIWQGDPATITWTVSANRDAGTGPQITGQVNITNGGSVPTTDLATNLVVTQPPSTKPIMDPVHLTTENGDPLPQLGPGQTGTYKFKINLPAGTQPGAIKVTAQTTISDHSGHLGTAFGPNEAWSGTLGAPTVQGSTLHVTDGDGIHAWDFTGSGQQSQSFDQTVKPDATPDPDTHVADQTYDNTVKADDGETVTAHATVHVWGLGVEKVMHGLSYDKTYRWALGDPSMPNPEVTVKDGGSYSVPVTVTVQDSNWQAGGTITITNNSPLAAHDIKVTDSLPVQLKAGEHWPTDLLPGQKVTLDFTYAPTNGEGGTSSADVALANGSTFHAETSYGFAGVAANEIDKTATIHNIGTITGDDTTDNQGTGSPGDLHPHVQEP